MNEYDNKKAIDFFGEEIVNNLETQHQDGYPNYYEKINSSSWQFGDIAEYIEKDTRWFDYEYASVYGELCDCEGYNANRLEVMVNPSNVLNILKEDK